MRVNKNITLHDLLYTSNCVVYVLKDTSKLTPTYINKNSNNIVCIVFYECYEIFPSDKLPEKLLYLAKYLGSILKGSKKKKDSNPFVKLFNSMKKTALYQSYADFCLNILIETSTENITFIPLPYNRYSLNLSFYGLTIKDLI